MHREVALCCSAGFFQSVSQGTGPLHLETAFLVAALQTATVSALFIYFSHSLYLLPIIFSFCFLKKWHTFSGGSSTAYRIGHWLDEKEILIFFQGFCELWVTSLLHSSISSSGTDDAISFLRTFWDILMKSVLSKLGNILHLQVLSVMRCKLTVCCVWQMPFSAVLPPFALGKQLKQLTSLPELNCPNNV